MRGGSGPPAGRSPRSSGRTSRDGGGCTGRGFPSRGCSRECDFGDGPRIGGAATVLFCFWLAWSRFRVVIPLLDKSWPSVASAIDTALRQAGGVPTYLLTDNQKTVAGEHVAGLPGRNPAAVAFGRPYG